MPSTIGEFLSKIQIHWELLPVNFGPLNQWILNSVNSTKHKRDVRLSAFPCLVICHFLSLLLAPISLSAVWHRPAVDLWWCCLYIDVLHDLKSSEAYHGLSWPCLRFHTLYLMLKPVIQILPWEEGNINITVSSENWETDALLLLVTALKSNSCIIKCLMSTACEAGATLVWLITFTSCSRNPVTHARRLMTDLTTERDQRLIPRRFPHVNICQTSLQSAAAHVV